MYRERRLFSIFPGCFVLSCARTERLFVQGCFRVTIKSGITEGEETGEGGIKDKAGRGADGA